MTFEIFDPAAVYVERKAAYAVILRAETVAVVKGRNGKFFLPGGGALPDETVEATVLREIREELGCEARITRRLGEAEQYFYAASDNCHYRMEGVFVTAELQDGPSLALGAEEEELLWLPLHEVDDTLFHRCHAWAVNMVVSDRDAATKSET